MIAATYLSAAIFFGEDEQRQLPSIPFREGVAGSFAGVSHGALLVGGGANFPDKKPWDGGKKAWHDSVFVLEKPTGEWKLAGKLPRKLGYGVSVTHRSGVVCVGGSDADRHYQDAFRLDWRYGTLTTTALPPLPEPLANGCGTVVGDILFVAAGQNRPDSTPASRAVWSIDLGAPHTDWNECKPLPGPGRILSVAAGFDGAFWIVGGAELVAGKNGSIERRYLKEAFRYLPKGGWSRIADLPHPIAAAPSPAPTDAVGFFILGGDDGTQVTTLPPEHRGFSDKVLRYQAKSAQWIEHGKLSDPCVTVPCVRWSDSWVMPSGEIRPGVRSPKVRSWKPGRNE